MLIFDIETGPLPRDELMAFYTPPDLSEFEPSEFDPTSVAVGNMGAVKAAEKVAKLREQHEERQAKLPALRQAAEARHLEEFVDGAALLPQTGKVEAVGFLNGKTNEAGIVSGDECDILSTVWSKTEKCFQQNRKMIGHNIFGFDLPFLFFRSWVHEIDIPMNIVLQQDRYFNSQLFADTMSRWFIGKKGGYVKIDDICKAFGLPGKPENVSGATFWQFWRGTAEERQQAEAYLLNDLQMTAAVARRMQIF